MQQTRHKLKEKVVVLISERREKGIREGAVEKEETRTSKERKRR
jgi:hypothetical protein